MERRAFLKLPAAAAVQAGAKQDKPNILWICTDQQRSDTIGATGNSRIRTPNMDRLARQGVAFTNAYCQNPVCTPSRASFMTGCYPDTLHVHRNGNAWFPPELRPRLISRILQANGYDCGLVGKLHLSACEGRVEQRFDDGYRLFEWSHHPHPQDYWPVEKHAYQAWLREKGVKWDQLYRSTKVPGCPPEYQPGMPARYHEVTWCTETALAFLQGKLRAPWFISMHTFAPHPPFDPPPEALARMDLAAMPKPLWRDTDLAHQRRFEGIDHQTTPAKPVDSTSWRHLVAAYYAQVEFVDAQIGRLLDGLDNTIVILSSDHGEMLGDHGLVQKGCRFYEGAVHVPLILSWPGHFRQGLRATGLVDLADIVPTLLESLEMPVPDYMQGQSLRKICTGEAAPGRHREFARSTYHDSLDLPHHTHATMVRDRRYKLVRYHTGGLGELFDLEEDPGEFRNLYDDPAHLRTRNRLAEMLFDSMMTGADLGQPRIAKF